MIALPHIYCNLKELLHFILETLFEVILILCATFFRLSVMLAYLKFWRYYWRTWIIGARAASVLATIAVVVFVSDIYWIR